MVASRKLLAKNALLLVLVGACTESGSSPGMPDAGSFGIPDAGTATLVRRAGPLAVEAGDWNGDGKPDLVVANTSSNDVSVLLGDGLGGFGPAAVFSVGTDPRAIALGDFNADSKLDLAVANNGSNDVSVLFGNGLGGFARASSFPVGTNPYSIVVGDWNGDGKLDLAVANYGSDDIGVLLGDGLGAFGPPARIPVGAGPQDVVAGDFNGDGKTDLVTANAKSYDLSMLLGNGLGSFGPAARIAVDHPGVYGHLAVADLNADHRLDLIVAGPFYEILNLFGDGMGGFTTSPSYNVGGFPTSIVAMRTGDFNGDRVTDLAIATALVMRNDRSYSVFTWLGDSTGVFAPAARHEFPEWASGVALADFNGDKMLDLAFTLGVADQVSVMLGDGLGGLGKATHFNVK